MSSSVMGSADTAPLRRTEAVTLGGSAAGSSSPPPPGAEEEDRRGCCSCQKRRGEKALELIAHSNGQTEVWENGKSVALFIIE